MGLKVYVDGEYFEKGEAKVSVFDRGLLYGDGVFEGIRAYAGRVFRMDAHIDRLYKSAKGINLKIPVTQDEMKKVITDTLAVNDLKDAYIRLVVTRGVASLGLDPDECRRGSIICITDSIALYPKALYETGLDVITVATRRVRSDMLPPAIKSLNYLNNIMAKIEAKSAGVLEAIMLNADGTVAECTGDNIFIVRDGVIYTPDVASGILEGVTRQAVIELAREENIEVVEGRMTRFEVFTADECFLTGTAAEIIPVVKVDRRTIGTGRPGAVTNRLLAKFHELVSREEA